MSVESSFSPLLRGLLGCACVVVVLAGIKAASLVVVPFVLACFIAMICHPLVNLLVRWRLPRGLAILLVVVIIVLLLLALTGMVGSSVNSFARDVPRYRSELAANFHWLTGQLARFNISLTPDLLMEYLDPGMAMNLASNMLKGFSSLMSNLFLLLLTVVFMLMEAQSLPRRLHLAIKDPQMRMSQLDRFLDSVNRYMAIKTLISLGTGLFAGLAVWLIGVDYAPLWGLLAFLLNYIPNIGSIIAAVPPVLLALLQLGPVGAAGVAAVYLVINFVAGNLIEPRVMGRGLGISDLVVFLSLIFWGWLLGPVGMLLSVPLTMVVKIGVESSQGLGWLSALLSNGQGFSKP
ncbi:MAG: AI-2E family transporter [Aeromonadaceae bacterium]|nr:AI-2E family transporter [Aeromonadaceae bacterium]